MQILLLSSSILLAFLCWQCINLAKNYITARKFGLPILITPIAFFNPVWRLSRHYVTPFLKALPFNIGSFIDYTGFSWFFPNRYRHHARFGTAFAIVSPGEVQIVLADADAVENVLARRKDFASHPKLVKPLGLFGPNILTSSNEAWQRQRRLTTPPFNERNSSFVWKHALEQSDSMLKTWKSQGGTGIEKTTSDTMTLALHVLIAAGLGRTYKFDGGTTDLEGAHKISYRDALKTILGNLFLAIVVNSVSLPTAILPRRSREIKYAIKEFREYMKEMMEEDRKSLRNADAGKDNLMTVLLRTSESKENEGRDSLSDDEILGNLFVYNVAGHDTTANTLAYCIYLLSVEPNIQAWIREEIQSVFGIKEAVKDWQYEESFPRLKRCFALMNETLRLYGPAVVNVRYTGNQNQNIDVQGKAVNLPPETFIMINIAALNTLPEYWGSDSLVWRPDRWITKDGKSQGEEIWQPQHHAFIPFSSGPRSCPGKRFAQVEFVAVIARLFRRNQCSPVFLDGETMVEAKKRVLNVVEDSNLVVTLKMRHPEKVKLRWEEVF